MDTKSKYIIKGAKLESPISQECLGVQVFNALKRNIEQDDVAMIDVTNKITTTYSKLLDQSLKIAQFLRNEGFQPGSILSVCSENNVNFIAPIFAAFYNGMTVAPMNNTYSLDELKHALDLAKPSVLFCSHSVFPQIVRLFRRKNCIKYVRRIFAIETIDDVFGNVKVDLEKFVPIPVDLHDTAIILYSSGTTGLPKGVMLTHININLRSAQVQQNDFISQYRDKTLSVSPFFHAMGIFFAINYILAKTPVIFFQRFDEHTFYSIIEKYKISLLYIVPPIVLLLAKSPKVDNYDLSSIKEISCGAAPLSPDVERIVKKRLNLKSVRQGYGMSETTLGVIVMPISGVSAKRTGSTGKVLPNMECIVRDPESGKRLGPNQVGELCFKGGVIMKGYHNNPDATKEMFTDDGWLKTGDLGYYDKDQYFYIVDRLKELIKFKGFQVPPAEIEAVLLTHRDVKDAAVVGLPDERVGELPLAFVVRQPNTTTDEDDIKRFIAKKLSYAKRLHGGVRFVDAIPKNPSGKVLRRVLRDTLRKMPSKL